MTRAVMLVACVALLAQTFRSQADVVTISASVKKGKQPIAGLSADDFRLTDNGVPQRIELVTVEAVPIDVSLFLDTSASTAGVQDRMKRDIQAIAAMLRPIDRYRVITIGLSVDESVPWQAASADITLSVRPLGGVSLIYDAITAALLHPIEVGRRHLVVALTDGIDCGSVIDGPTLVEVSARTEAVLYVVDAHRQGAWHTNGAPAWCTPYDFGSVDFLERAADRTGGAMHSSVFRDPTIREFSRILDDFRASYVLRYSASGVGRPGWHAVAVEVPKIPGATVRARSGYFAGRSD
jgi:Ca-activated chloride channel family protein